MEEKRKRRKLRDIESTRTQILDAFVSVLARKGIAKTTIEDVAKEAGFASGTIYNYFTSKVELVSAMKEWILDFFLQFIGMPVPEGTSFAVRVRFVLDQMFSLAESQR